MQIIQDNDYGYWIKIEKSQIYLLGGNIPFGYAENFHLSKLNGIVIGSYQGYPVWLIEEIINEELNPPSDSFYPLRSQIDKPTIFFNLLNRGASLNHFWSTHKFCGKCGNTMLLTMPDEIAAECSVCHYRRYPVISPSIIVAIRHENKILLANHTRHIDDALYTTLAGFVEAGEPLEDTVRREVFEESGLNIKNIRYFGSQPWSFPNSLMIGFFADYESGDIKIQPEELHDAQWFKHDELPNIPPKGTIAYKLITATCELCKQYENNKLN